MFRSEDARQGSGAAWLALALAWTAIAAPFARLGFGSDVDAWLVGQRALEMWRTGTYARSRSTGFPLYEIAVTPLVVIGGWLMSNALSVVSGLAVLALMFQLARRGSLRHPLLTSATLLLTPVFLKNATSTMDYVPATAMLLWAYLALHLERPLTAAALVGLACGIRPTMAIVILAAAAAAGIHARQWRLPLAMGLVATVVGTIAFFPSLRLGASFGIAQVTGWANGILNGMRMLGIAQTSVVAALVAGLLWRARTRLFAPREQAFVAFHVVNVVTTMALFAWLPGEPEYLFPCLLSLVLLVDRHASLAMATAIAMVLASYHLVALDVQGSRGGQRRAAAVMTRGLTLRDADDRRFKLWLRHAVTEAHVGDAPVLFMEQILPPTVGNDAFRYDATRDIFVRRDGRLAVSQLITDIAALEALRASGMNVVAWRAREFEYRLEDRRPALGLVDFVDDPGMWLGRPIKGRPADLSGPLR